MTGSEIAPVQMRRACFPQADFEEQMKGIVCDFDPRVCHPPQLYMQRKLHHMLHFLLWFLSSAWLRTGC